MSLHYIEFVSVRRHILQVEADGEEDCLEKARAHANGDWVEGLVISDDEKALLLHEPYGSFDFGEADEAAWFAGNPFGESADWMRDAARRLTFLADKADAESEETTDVEAP